MRNYSVSCKIILKTRCCIEAEISKDNEMAG